MKIIDRSVYVGPSLYAHFPVIRLDVDLGPLEEWPTGRLGPQFIDGLLAALPGLVEHGCSYGEPGGFVRRLTEDEGTWMGHILEHVAIELQAIAAVVIAIVGVFARADFPTPAGSAEARAPFAFWILLLLFLGTFAAQVARRVQLIAAAPGTAHVYSRGNPSSTGTNINATKGRFRAAASHTRRDTSPHWPPVMCCIISRASDPIDRPMQKRKPMSHERRN